MKYDILEQEILLKEFFTIYKAKVQFEHFDGSQSEAVDRLCLDKEEAIAVLVYHVNRDEYILVKQFRYPLCHHDIDPWMIEIVAGGIKKGEDPAEAAKREIMEEIGYQPLHLHKITGCYVSPGIMNEKVNIFLAEVDESMKKNNGGGAHDEDEDIQLIHIPRAQARQWLEDQKVGDAKTIIAIQWHLDKVG